MAGRRRRRASAFPQGGGTVGNAGGGADPFGAFEGQPDLGGSGPGGGGAGGITINNINTAIAQAAGRDLKTGPVGPVIGGGGGMMQMMPGQMMQTMMKGAKY